MSAKVANPLNIPDGNAEIIRGFLFSKRCGKTKTGLNKWEYAVLCTDQKVMVLSAFTCYEYPPELVVIIIFERHGNGKGGIKLGKPTRVTCAPSKAISLRDDDPNDHDDFDEFFQP